MDKLLEQAWCAAVDAREHAYTPYSGFKVGAAVVLGDAAAEPSDQKIFSGCNVENASYGATICAERNAILSAVRNSKADRWAESKGLFKLLVVVTDEPEATPPCAQCLQVLAEFCGPDFPVYLANLEGVVEKLQFRDLLPHPFDGSPLRIN